jgi:hypothetical protein
MDGVDQCVELQTLRGLRMVAIEGAEVPLRYGGALRPPRRVLLSVTGTANVRYRHSEYGPVRRATYPAGYHTAPYLFSCYGCCNTSLLCGEERRAQR